MARIVTEEINWSRYKNFTRREFECNCNFDDCEKFGCKEELIEKLQQLRDAVGFPIRLSSSYRCKKWNDMVGGHPNSSHKEGLAIDCLCEGERALILIENAIRLGFTGVGISQRKGQKFLHLDIKKTPTKRIWSYA